VDRRWWNWIGTRRMETSRAATDNYNWFPAKGGLMRLNLIHPCIGRRIGQPYIRLWQMDPLPPAVIAGLTPREVDVKFYDDRMERSPLDEPSDLVGISVETYTAKRAYQIASEYRKR